MADKSITPGTSGNLQTALGGAPSASDNFYINKGAENYTTVPDWTGTNIGSVFIGPGFAGNIGTTPWKIQADQAGSVVVIEFSGQYIYLSPGGSTIAEIRHKPAQGGILYLEGDAGGTVDALRSWGPCIVGAGLPTLTALYVNAGHTLVRNNATALGATCVVAANASCTVERDLAGAEVHGTLTLNHSGITPSGTVTVHSGGTLKIVECGTWATTTGTLVLLPGSVLDMRGVVGPVQFENLTHHAGAVILVKQSGASYTVNGTEDAQGGGAQVLRS